jgi:hypothetical protein
MSKTDAKTIAGRGTIYGGDFIAPTPKGPGHVTAQGVVHNTVKSDRGVYWEPDNRAEDPNPHTYGYDLDL